MRELILHGVDADGTHLLLGDDSGAQYRLALDESLYAAVRRDRAVVRSDAPVRPRDIQAMIRGGMSAEEVIAATGADAEQVRTYERPALAERAHMAHTASRHPIYSDHDPNGDPTPLVELAQTRLAMRDVDIETMDWDAWKQQDGNWYVELSFIAADRKRTAGWNYYRGSLTALDDEAKWLADSGPTDTGPIPGYSSNGSRRTTEEIETPQPEAPAEARAERPATLSDHQAETGRILENLRRRRSRSEDDDEPRGRLRAVTEDPETHPQGAHTAPGRPEDATDDEVIALEDRASTPSSASGDDGASGDDEQEPTQEVGTFDDDNQLSLLNEPGVSDGVDAPKESESRSKKKGSRASIPSWDEIMFGSKRD
ncbi:septation protein SepH [Brevibacterium ammoniilyticum]|uniref:Septation protein SepH n=1 Tax=Brevibacterium ammoniilyticum TaxID=1046555 RepID=A0ABP9U315_9MICO